MQHDTSPHDLHLGGAVRRVQTASLVLGYSRMLFFQFYPRFRRFECKVFLTEALRYMDGACQTCMIDNTHVVVLTGTGRDMIPVPEMAAFAERFGFTFVAHAVGDANRSGRVERMFRFIERGFLPGRRFTDWADANRQARAWCDRVNARPKRQLKATPRELFAVEHPALRRLPRWIPEPYLLHERLVDVEGYITLHTNHYSVPTAFIGRRLEVRETPGPRRHLRRGPARSPRMPARPSRAAATCSGPSIARPGARAGGTSARRSPRSRPCAACCPRSRPTSPPSSTAASCRPRWPCASSCAWPASIRASPCSRPSRPRPTTASTTSAASSAWSCAASPPRTSSSRCRSTPSQESPTMSRPMDELQQLLKNLHLSRMAESLPEELQRAEKDGLAYTDLLLRLVRAQWHHRQETALEWRIRQARLPERWALETFPFKDQPGVNKRQIMSLAELDFIPTATNIVFIGATGVGKSGLAIGLLLKALQNGYRALFIKAQDLFDELYASLADRSSRKLVDRLARVPVLCIDEMGYLNLRPEQCNIFFKLMEERYRRRASIITTNLDYDDWLNFLGNKHMVTALLSRLRHQCTTIRIDGPSLREPQG